MSKTKIQEYREPREPRRVRSVRVEDSIYEKIRSIEGTFQRFLDKAINEKIFLAKPKKK